MYISFDEKSVKDSDLQFVIMLCKYNEKIVLCKHKDRDTYECPGGRRENYETIIETAKRELYEETGAVEYNLKILSNIAIKGFDGVIENKKTKYGCILLSKILKIEKMPKYEIDCIKFFKEIPNDWTYPEIEPVIFKKYVKELSEL